MRCPHCDFEGKIEVTNSVKWDGRVYRARKCTSCGGSFKTGEEPIDEWPEDMWSARKKGGPKTACKGRDRVRRDDGKFEEAPVIKANVAPRGSAAHLQAFLFTAVAPKQQSDPV